MTNIVTSVTQSSGRSFKVTVENTKPLIGVSISGRGPQGEEGIQGLKGDTGNAFVYEDFTGPQLLALTGPQGEQGIQGIQGEQGAQGEQGIQGLKGDIGEQGIQGERGEQGIQGEQGVQGDTGERGIQGIQGEKGNPFVYTDFTPTQLNGLKGLKGDKGDTGEQGVQGEIGLQGEQGEQGVQGLKGDKGDTGEQGIQGIQGVQGDKGDKGDALGYLPLPISGGVLENHREKLVTLNGTSTLIDLSLANVFTHNLTGNTSYTITSAVSDQAHSFTLIITQTATVRTLTFPASVKWQGGEIPGLTTASKTYVLTFMTVDGGTTWLGMFGGEF